MVDLDVIFPVPLDSYHIDVVGWQQKTVEQQQLMAKSFSNKDSRASSLFVGVGLDDECRADGLGSSVLRV